MILDGSAKNMQRNEARKHLAAMFDVQKQAESTMLCRNVLAWPEFLSAQLIIGFVPADSEPDVWPLLRHAYEHGASVALVRIAGGTIELRLWDGKPGTAGFERLPGTRVLQPAGQFPLLEIAEIVPGTRCLVLVPGLAFGERGERLGRGGGWYDRLLATLGEYKRKRKLQLVCAGVGFSVQLVQGLHVQPHDYWMDAVFCGAKSYRKSGADSLS